jgi:hypothetical protein
MVISAHLAFAAVGVRGNVDPLVYPNVFDA